MLLYRSLLLMLLAALAGCAGPAAVVPTATPVPPTATPVSTATPVPTATPAPTATTAPTAAAVPTGDDSAAAAAIRAAVEQTGQAASYRTQATFSATGLPLAPGSTSTEPVELLALEGNFVGQTYEYTLSGFVAAFLGAGEGGLEIVRVDETTYVRGPLPLLNAPEAVWYRMPPEQGSQLAPPITPSSTLPANADLSGFSVGAAGERDGLSCQSYLGDREATLALAESVGQTTGGGFNPEDVREATMTLWICEDGYLHETNLNMIGEADDPTTGTATPFSIELIVRAFDFGADISISAPADAQDLPTP